MNKIPYSLLPVRILERHAHHFYGLASRVGHFFPFLKIHLQQANSRMLPQAYVSMCLLAATIFFAFMLIVLSPLFFVLKVKSPFLVSATITIVLSFFVAFQQMMYPRVIATRRIKDIERNLLPALQSMMVQLNAGIPLFNIMVNVSMEDYGAVSSEFKGAVKEINAGRRQAEVLEEMASRNPSVYFRRAVWQIVNGMKAGSNIGLVIDEVIKGLGEERILQIRNYGAQLNPLAMFYMLFAVIIPSLSVTFVTILCSLLGIPELIAKMVFWGLFGFVLFFQVMFLGVIKMRRPNLLG